jgi:hypothetical protein
VIEVRKMMPSNIVTFHSLIYNIYWNASEYDDDEMVDEVPSRGVNLRNEFVG